MPSLIVQANDTAQQVAAERKNACHHLESLTLDGDLASGDRVIKVQDVFTPSVTAGVSSPSETTVDRWRATIPQGFIETYGERDLKGIKCLGALKIISSVTDASLYVTCGYETK